MRNSIQLIKVAIKKLIGSRMTFNSEIKRNFTKKKAGIIAHIFVLGLGIKDFDFVIMLFRTLDLVLIGF